MFLQACNYGYTWLSYFTLKVFRRIIVYLYSYSNSIFIIIYRFGKLSIQSIYSEGLLLSTLAASVTVENPKNRWWRQGN